MENCIDFISPEDFLNFGDSFIEEENGDWDFVKLPESPQISSLKEKVTLSQCATTDLEAEGLSKVNSSKNEIEKNLNHFIEIQNLNTLKNDLSFFDLMNFNENYKNLEFLPKKKSLNYMKLSAGNMENFIENMQTFLISTKIKNTKFFSLEPGKRINKQDEDFIAEKKFFDKKTAKKILCKITKKSKIQKYLEKKKRRFLLRK